jgi:zinc/manganese transport system ATP-binding protein
VTGPAARPADLAGGSAVLSVSDVSVSLGGRQVLDQVSFELRRGEFAGLIGPNGAGKTTLLRVILGLQRPASGEVAVLGRRRTSLRHQPIGYVPQKVLLDASLPMRARDLVALGADGSDYGLRLPSAERSAAVTDMLRAVDADRFADARVGTLSGGEQQRILIAHALISRPPLLLLDEPLANLDLRSGREIVGLLARIAREQQLAVLLSAHELNPLLPVLDRVVYLAGGRAASGPTADVITADVLSRLYGHPVEVVHAAGRILVVAGDESAEPADSAAAAHAASGAGRDRLGAGG